MGRPLWSLIICIAIAGAWTPPARGQTPPDFAAQVLPLLQDNCFVCHGQDDQSRKGKLRLDTLAAAAAGGKSGRPAIVAGKPAESEMLTRITTADADRRMPPPDSKKILSPAQIDTLRRWIETGATYQRHWGFEPPVRPAIPTTANTVWPRNDLDRLVLAALERQRLAPSPEADKATLLRRLSLDLIGLPPSPAELDAFLADTSPQAYAKQVDRLLASPHYGEKWARPWLDAARYADSDGYEKDLPRKQWPWRDWVINALNRDLPYDQFIIEQIAGDLLPNATQSQRIATGFLRNGMVNEEGAVIAEQFRMEGLIDRMDCIGKSVLGLTIQCAQCHTHKFDPLTQTEYFRLLAFLNNDYEATTWIYTDVELEKISAVKKGVADLQARVKLEHPDWPQQLAAWESRLRAADVKWQHLSPTEQEWIGGLAHPQKQPDDSILTLGFRPSDGDLYVVGESNLRHITGLRFEAMTHGDLPFGGPGRSAMGTFAVSELIVEAMPADAKDAKFAKVELANATATFAQPDQLIGDYFRKGNDDKRRVGPASFLIDGKEETAWGADAGPGRRHQDMAAVIQFAKPIEAAANTKFKVTLRFKHAGRDIHGRDNNFLGRFRLSLTDQADPRTQPTALAVRRLIDVPAQERTPEQQSAIFSAFLANTPEFAAAHQESEKLWVSYPQGETVLNLAQRPPEDARQTRLLERGDWQKPTQVVTPGTPAFLHSLPADAAPNRLTFARWLVDRKSPTAARVAVNRMWQNVFGVGIVETVEDFGVRAAEPTNAPLLDWLAVELMDHGWSQKQLLREIVLSSTYRQAARAAPDLLDRDPQNRLLARGPRFRADGEIVRDVALAASGLLTDKVGGPSFFPPAPASLFAQSYLDVDFWQTATGADRYRRSLYAFRRRSMPDPLLSCFDAPSGEVACARRVRSNTPLAALAGLNEPVMVEAARAMALRVLREGGDDEAMRAAYAFRLCTSRVPHPAEVGKILELLQSQKLRIADGWMSARLLTTGDAEKLPALPPGVTPTDAAAWTLVSRVLLNLDETVTKN